MVNHFGSLGDFFPGKDIKCRIRGCENRIHLTADQALNNVVGGKEQHAPRMCDECYQRLATLEDKTMPCSKPGCSGTWVWNRYQQLEAYAMAKGDTPKVPRGFCEKCQAEMKEFTPKEIPCKVKGCKNTWTYSAKEQLANQGKATPAKLCNSCYETLKKLQDKELPCRIKGCKNTVVWSKYQQLEHIVAGNPLDAPPARMCEECIKLYGTLKNEEKECKINGCKNTWTLTAYDQLEAIRNTPEGETPVMPSKMCKNCFNFYSQAKDIQVPCKNHNCQNTWTWTRSMQLGAHVFGSKKPNPKYCEACQKELESLQDIPKPCATQGCTGTWNYRAEDQLKDKSAHRNPPTNRLCPACHQFLQENKPIMLTCPSCGTEFSWSVQEQLGTHLGVFVKPSKCPDCIKKELQTLVASPATIQEPPADEKINGDEPIKTAGDSL